jgi:hypothetical protein
MGGLGGYAYGFPVKIMNRYCFPDAVSSPWPFDHGARRLNAAHGGRFGVRGGGRIRTHTRRQSEI